MSATVASAPPAPDDVSNAPGYATHEVLNQAGALVNYNAFAGDIALVEAAKLFEADWADGLLRRTGTVVGSEKVQYLAHQANRHLPELKTHDRLGNRVELVEFHPAYHELMGLIFGSETHSFAWTHQGKGNGDGLVSHGRASPAKDGETASLPRKVLLF